MLEFAPYSIDVVGIDSACDIFKRFKRVLDAQTAAIGALWGREQ